MSNNIDSDVPLPQEEQYTIEKNVPLPTNLANKYPFKQMEVGDSFFVSDHIASVKTIAQRQVDGDTGQRMKFTIRAQGHGWRVWRIK